MFVVQQQQQQQQQQQKHLQKTRKKNETPVGKYDFPTNVASSQVPPTSDWL